jgi:hypothetical protein
MDLAVPQLAQSTVTVDGQIVMFPVPGKVYDMLQYSLNVELER